ncbi:MAG TPA: MFS transporter, partial [Jatrophihabitans sp.]|nr:MFS transporter [Jatrophihabitans sp.]
IIGPALGGLLTGAVGATSTLLVDAASFALLTIAVAFVRSRRPPAAAPDRAIGVGAWEGFRLLWRSPVLRIALQVSAVATGCAVVDNVAAPFRFLDQLGTGDFGYGVYLTVWSAGALIGVQLLPHLAPRHHGAALAAGNLLTGLGIAGIGVAPSLAVAFASSLVGGFGNGLVNVAQNVLIAAHTPREQHGRAFAAAAAVMQAAIGIGTAAAAPLVTTFGAGRAMAGAGALAALAAAVGFVRLATATRSTPMTSAARGEGEIGVIEAGGHDTGNQTGAV